MRQMEATNSRGDATVSYFSSLLKNLASTSQPLVENTVGANEELESIRDVFNSEWYFALSDFDQRSETASSSDKERSEAVAALQAAWGLALSAAMARSFRKGYGSRGRQDSSSLTYEKIVATAPLFKKIVDKHTSFANQFAQQYASGRTSRKGAMGVGARSNMYGQALKGAYNAGAVYGGISDDKVWWRLGACEHCPDCIALAASGPYTMATLPTLPGNGDTLCKTNCCCHLTFVRGPKRLEPDNTLSSWMDAGEDGDVQEDESGERRVRELQDLMLKRAFIRRVSLDSDDITSAQVDKANASAKSITQQIDSLVGDSESLKLASRYNPGSIITQGDISQVDMERIFMGGIDGPSIFRADIDSAISELDSVIKKFDASASVSRSIPRSTQDEDRVPKVGAFATYNIVSDGAAATLTTLRKLLQILGDNELFIEIGSMDDSLERIVGFSGIWIRGQRNEAESAIDLLLQSDSVFSVGEVVFI